MEFYISPIDRTKPTLVLGDQAKFVSLSKWQFEIKGTVSFISLVFQMMMLSPQAAWVRYS